MWRCCPSSYILRKPVTGEFRPRSRITIRFLDQTQSSLQRSSAMDKIKSVFNGEQSRTDDRTVLEVKKQKNRQTKNACFTDTVETQITTVVSTDETVFIQTVNEASTLGWGTRVKGFIACFVVGAACTILVSRHVCIHFYDQRGRAQGELMWPYWFFLPRGMLYSDVDSSGNFHQVALKCHLQSGEVLNKSVKTH